MKLCKKCGKELKKTARSEFCGDCWFSGEYKNVQSERMKNIRSNKKWSTWSLLDKRQKDGLWVNKEDISEGTKKLDKSGYVSIYINFCWISEHRWVWEQTNGPIPKDHDIHHIDHNKQNNSLDNLKCVSPAEHRRIHQKEFIPTEEWKQKISKTMTGRTYSAERIANCNAGIAKRAYKHTEEEKKKISEASKKMWAERRKLNG